MHARQAGAEDREPFDSFVSSSPLADVLQSWEWGEVKRSAGWEPLRIIVEEENQVVGTCSVLFNRPARLLPPLAYCPRGPVLATWDEPVLQSMIDQVRQKAGGAFVLICDPGVGDGSAASKALRAAGFRTSTAGAFGGVQPRAVMVLDLRSDHEALLAGFKSKWRYNIRLAERKGVKVREASRGDLVAFYDLLVTTARRDGFFVRGRSYFESLWDLLAPRAMLKLFLADFSDAPVAGIMLFAMGGRVTYIYGASSNEHRNVMPNHLLQWHAISWAKESGFEMYDFRGVSPVVDGKPAEPKIAGLNRFKEGFGARYVEYAGQFELPLRRGWHLLWKTAGPAAISILKTLRPPVQD